MIERVVRRDACSGCGACALLDPGISMITSNEGYSRPRRTENTTVDAAVLRKFESACPGIVVSAAPRLPGMQVHPTMGTHTQAWRAWANDPDFRYNGSSGGALSALAAWLVETGRAHQVTGVAAAQDPRRTVPVTIQSRTEALASAGSRYAPVPAASNPLCLDSSSAIISKPCETSALRALHESPSGDQPLLLSFFCAGTPRATATDQLLTDLGAPQDTVPSKLRYRGQGWPGAFSARVGDTTYSTSYHHSWGKVLGRTVQWRCKICVDGIGERADVVAADLWNSDEDGYPVFDDAEGVSALIARTYRGRDVVADAVRAGVLCVEPLDIDQLAHVQPLQVERRSLLAARLAGSLLSGRKPPRYRGFRLLRLVRRQPRLAIRVLRGTASRVRRAGRPDTET